MPLWSRRNLLTVGTLATLTAACTPPKSPERKHIAVVGGGIIGASIAYHLARIGAQVTVLERHAIATRASRGTFAWLNATWAKQPRHYHTFSQLGLAIWKELEQDLGIPIKWDGSVEWFTSNDRQALLAKQIEEQVEWGEPARMVSRDVLRSLEPNVIFRNVKSAAFSPNDGALDPVLATAMLFKEAQILGATIKTQCEVTGVRNVDQDYHAILETSLGDIEVDAYVLATGADTSVISGLAGIDIPQRSTPGVIAVTKALAPLLNRIVVAPGVHIHQRLDGRIVLGEQEGAPQTEAHAARLAERPNRFPTEELAQQHASRILAIAKQYLPALADAEIEEVYIGWRPLPLDGHPAIGFSTKQPRAYIAIAHSGVSLAPIIGRLAAQEIVEGVQIDALAYYRPDRSFEEVRRY